MRGARVSRRLLLVGALLGSVGAACSAGADGRPAATPEQSAIVEEPATTPTTVDGAPPSGPTGAPTEPGPSPVREPRGDPATRVVGYYAGWEHDTLAPDALPEGLLTHVVYAFAVVQPESRCVLADPTTERRVIAALQAWKARTGAATLLGVGGWEGSRGFSDAAATVEGRAALADSCWGLARELGFDGIDVDWEYPSGGKWPGRIADPARHVALVEALRARVVPGEVLTVATPASPGALETFGLRSLAALVDWFHVMAYDLAGPWDERTGHNAPLVATAGPFGVDAAIAAYERAGIPPASLVLGVPFFGHAFAEVDGIGSSDGGLGRTFTGTPRSVPTGAIPFRAVTRLLGATGWQRHFDERARVPWLVDVRARVLISYDDAASVSEKAAFARREGLGGMMVWELSGDDAGFTLLRAMNVALGRSTS